MPCAREPLAAEVAAWRRFPAAQAFMGWTGLVPAGYSSGERTRRGHITKAGSEPVRTALIEAAWANPGASSPHHAKHQAQPDTPCDPRGPGAC